MTKAKSFVIDKRLVWEAYKKVKAKKGAGGVDGETMEAFEENLAGKLYKLWNRMSSGSYFPSPVKLVEIPKADGGKRALGIPTVVDRVAQRVVKQILEPALEPHFHRDSYGYRPGKSAHQALAKARECCWRKDWVIDLDIKGFFDNLSHELVMKALEKHTKEKWIHLYVRRWLEAPVQEEGGEAKRRDKGTPQGGVISPLLANLFMHYAFDQWMQREFPAIEFERYADDVIVHAVSEAQARHVLQAIRTRMRACGLEVHPEKTKIVYCQDDFRKENYKNVTFDFLGYTFRKRSARGRGKMFNSFLPAISDKAAQAIRDSYRSWKLHTRLSESLESIAAFIGPKVRGWIHYYGRYYKSRLVSVLWHLDRMLVRWLTRKYKALNGQAGKARRFLAKLHRRNPNFFAHWQLGLAPRTGQ